MGSSSPPWTSSSSRDASAVILLVTVSAFSSTSTYNGAQSATPLLSDIEFVGNVTAANAARHPSHLIVTNGPASGDFTVLPSHFSAAEACTYIASMRCLYLK